MTVMTAPPDIQWYLARDGRQHGPLSDVEMQKLVELNYLRPTDLLWRPGFANWLPALTVFPPAAIAAPPSPVAPSAPAMRPGPQPATGPGQASTQGQAPGPAATPGTQTGPGPGGPMTAAGAQRRMGRGALVPVEPNLSTEDADAEPARASGTGNKIAIAAAVLLLLGGAFAAVRYTTLGQKFGFNAKTDAPTPVAAAPKTPAGAPPAAKPGAATAPSPNARPAPLSGLTEEPATLDQRLQRFPMWALIKKEFPEWYAERLQETAKLAADKQTQPVVAKQVVDQIVALRRKHSDQALAASTAKLRTIASAFLANLRQLREYHQNACYSFISQGETSPVVVEMLQKPENADPIQAQIVAIFEAIGEGRRQPVQHATPSKDDYNLLADQLTKLGWSQSDLQLFADPRALARTSPERVCKMVHDWFVAHIEIKDAAAQERLLVETLRPVVSG